MSEKIFYSQNLMGHKLGFHSYSQYKHAVKAYNMMLYIINPLNMIGRLGLGLDKIGLVAIGNFL